MSFWQIWNMSFGFLGIQFGFALQNGNASAILQNFGAHVEELSWFWLVAPLTGMIVQPIIGHYSDRTWNKLGRRKPYFLVGTLICCVALLLLPNSGVFFVGKMALFIGAMFLMLMDACFSISSSWSSGRQCSVVVLYRCIGISCSYFGDDFIFEGISTSRI
jgi:maltose/moltooligosaccharide transporter